MNIKTFPADPSQVTADLKGVRISEIILQTSRYDDLKQWYMAVLGQKPFVENARPNKPISRTGQPEGGKQVHARSVRLCFFRLHIDYPYTQVFGLFEIDGLGDKPTNDPGLNHMQFRHESLEHAISRYEKLRSFGILPYRTANHGPGTSFYYHDLDGNVVEMSGPNFPTEKEYLDYFQSESYRNNISGIDVDPEEYVGRYRSGTPQPELVRIPV